MTPNLREKKPFKRERKSRDTHSKKKRTTLPCPCCKTGVNFLWKCKCGFELCQMCMQENLWGMTCNNVTWACPDCGEIRSY